MNMSTQSKVLITGGTSGIGKETAIALAKAGATVIFTARNHNSGNISKQEIIKKSGSENVTFITADLASMNDVRKLANIYISQHSRIDVLINNAGVMEDERKVSVDGFEIDFAVNYLAPFLLTNLLLPLMKSSAPSRIINVSSSLHRQGEIDFDDLQSERNFDRYKAYAQSKLALVLFTKKLARILEGSGVTVNALNPGVVDTNMNRKNIAHVHSLIRAALSFTFQTPAKGAETSVYLASSPDVANVSGEFFEKKKIEKSSPLSYDEALADRLWDVSTKLVGLR